MVNTACVVVVLPNRNLALDLHREAGRFLPHAASIVAAKTSGQGLVKLGEIRWAGG